MELTWKVTAICLIGAALTGLLKKSNPELALLLAGAACILVLSAVLSRIGEVFHLLEDILQSSALPGELFTPLLKTLAIGWISHTGADLCRDAGQTALGTVVEMVGTFSAVIAALPLFEEIWELLQVLL